MHTNDQFLNRVQWPEAGMDKTQTARTPRAQERVMNYLHEQFQRLDLPPGSRLPTSRELAGQLDVSVSTVQTVFRKLAEEGVIRSQVGNGSFLAKPPQKTPQALRIGISFGVTDETDPTQLWQIGIAGAVLTHCASMNQQMSVVPVNLHQETPKQMLAGMRALNGQIHGLIHRSHNLHESLQEELATLEYPVVFLNPPSFVATCNFVSVNYAQSGELVARAFLASKRKRVAIIESTSNRNFPISIALRHAGMMRECGFRCDENFFLQVFLAESHLEQSGFDVAGQLFAKDGYLPDAIYCSGDSLAAGVLRYCRGKKIKIPQEVSLIGGTGSVSHQSEFSELTRVGQPIQALGQELLAMVVEMAGMQNGRVPGKFLPASFLSGKTTLPAENKVLEILNA